MNEQNNKSIKVVKTSKLDFYYFYGNPRTNPMICIIEEMASKRQGMKLSLPTLQLIYSLLLTGRKLNEAYERDQKDGRPGSTEPISVYVPASNRDYKKDSKRTTGFIMPKINGIGLERVNKALSVIGQSKKRTSFSGGGLGFFQIKDGRSYGRTQSGQYRSITFTDPARWPIWEMLNTEEELFSLWAGYESLTDQVHTFTSEAYHAFRENHLAVIKDENRTFYGNQVEVNSSNFFPFLSAAPERLKREVQKINQAFPEDMAAYNYIRSFRDEIHHGGRLNSIFTRMPKIVRNKITDLRGLVEVDISNCAFTIFNTMAIGMSLKGDFYEKLAMEYSKRVQSIPALSHVLPE